MFIIASSCLHFSSIKDKSIVVVRMEEFELSWSNLELDPSLFYEEISQPGGERNTTNASDAELIMKKLENTKIGSCTNSKSKKVGKRKIIIENHERMDGVSGDEGLKKMDHNAKERIRRMKLNASYLALRALLPDHSRRSKKKWTAPAIVDRVLKYIPELEDEIEELRCSKENHVQSQVKLGKNNNPKPSGGYESPTISLNRVNQVEAIIQVCMAKEDESQFTNLLKSVEDDQEGICIKSASALYISETKICCHLHIKTSNTTCEADHQFQELLEKVVSWLS